MTTRIGFACNWDQPRETTWSGTPWQLLKGLERNASVIDLGIELPTLARNALRVAHARRADGRWRSEWKWSRTWDHLASTMIERAAERSSCTVVLQVQDVARLDVPYFSYQDLSLESLRAYEQAVGQRTPAFEFVSDRFIDRWADRQLGFYRDATGLFAMSEWLGASIAQTADLSRDKIHVVHPGINVPVRVGQANPDQRRRLLFVGRDFERKAGPLVLEAFRRARETAVPDLELTICGPDTWPGPKNPPPGVTFAGSLPPRQIAEMYLRHDLFVMPSHFEAFGIVFAEALAAGIPCVGRNAWAMPEMITPGSNGGLIDSDDPDELADTIIEVLGNDAIYDYCQSHAVASAEYFSWDRAASEMLEQLTKVTP